MILRPIGTEIEVLDPPCWGWPKPSFIRVRFRVVGWADDGQGGIKEVQEIVSLQRYGVRVVRLKELVQP